MYKILMDKFENHMVKSKVSLNVRQLQRLSKATVYLSIKVAKQEVKGLKF